MQNKTLLLLCSACSVTMNACVRTQYDLQLRLLSNGKEIAAPRLIVSEGQKASITQETANKKTKIDLVAKEFRDSLTLDVNLTTQDINGVNKTAHTGNFLLNISENQKAFVNFQGTSADSDTFISAFEVIAHKAENVSTETNKSAKVEQDKTITIPKIYDVK